MPRSAKKTQPSRRDCVRIGVAAGGIDERTVKDFFAGRRRTHPLVAENIRRAMAQLGMVEASP